MGMKESGFIESILKYDTEEMTDKTRDQVNKNYLQQKGWDRNAIQKASKVAGPVAIWVESQIQFGGLLKQMEPMRKELKGMKDAAALNQKELDAQQDQILE